MSPSPQYDVLKNLIDTAKSGNSAALELVRCIVAECVRENNDRTPAYAIIALGETLLKIREDDVLRG